MNAEQSVLYHTLLLSQLPAIGKITARKLITECGSAEAVLKEKKEKLLFIEGIRKNVVESIQKISAEVYEKVEREIDFIQKYNIHSYILTESDYPKRLRHCIDAPIVFFAKGNMDFNVAKAVAIVGTRTADNYGISVTKQIVAELSHLDVLIVSGLAYGIDTAAHEAAVHHNLQTVGVLGHGLQMLYPNENSKLASRMLDKGGVITEYCSGTIPDQQHFPERNRIIAGLSDAVVVVEARKEGGALITANLAFSYDRDVFAVPGRIGDSLSEGCNNLIKSNKAALISSANDIIEMMRWDDGKTKKKNRQEKLFFDLDNDEKQVIAVIQQHNEIDIDTLSAKINMPISRLTTLLLALECKSYIECLPGKRYTVI